jgi:ferrous iron transport protein B
MVNTAVAAPASKRSFLIAVIGNPNCGKTTLFNALTGMRQKVGNYPGVTVEKREGVMTGEPRYRLLDLPGTYSLSARSLDEQISRDVLLGRLDDTPRPDAVLIVIDATNLERNLYLASQVIDLGLPTVIACNVMDLLEEAGHKLDVPKLSAALGVAIVPTVGSRGRGLDSLRAAIKSACGQPAGQKPRAWRVGDEIEREVAALASAVEIADIADGPAADGAAMLLLSEGTPSDDSDLPLTVREAIRACLERLAANPDTDVATEVTIARYGWLGVIVDDCLVRAAVSDTSASDKLDRIFTHKLWGLLSFAGMMGLLFYSIFVLADPVMRLIEIGVTASQSAITRTLPAGPLTSLLRDGILAGAGNVVAFFPQICILFLFIALLEDTGYMARAAFLMDRIMSRVGLHGKSFIPLLSCHACAIPGIMAARTIENPKDRLTTILVAPLMSCSARLPVYTVLIAACLPGSPWIKAGVMLLMYGLGITAALTMATIFKKTLLRGPTPAFIMELPPYRMPRPLAILRVMWDRSRLFLTRAGTTILAMTVVLWAMMNFPKSAERTAQYAAERQAIQSTIAAPQQSEQLSALEARQAADNLEHSLAGRLGRAMEPAIKPLGFDWKIGIGMVGSFAAREVFISTMGVIYSVGSVGDDSATLRTQIATAKWPDGHRIFTPLVAVGLMVFYVLACQCVSTIAVVRRETNGWRWPAFMFAYMSVLAYAAALLIHQVGSLLHLGVA